ncbi:uncharacterized protein CC84DRAFT_1220909 [Paraphaeosphaeria sporulosa]|uniref:Lysine-specific metallo-endopeptidase domain-containing protein n=1 Tax=Paraphaeosphaeria sporulosa TaxID=1460663 RepID=A0A177C1S6_9PLEO|nr:uncharacterized protein CC84DRAFT_1220909 [Paraphaeosphaeria sporulosa]OAG01396.1 hypothetical protein CC84DRAFT_1220909 [Paraphaeosphaeria sporulosa]
MVFCDYFWSQNFPHLLDRVLDKPTYALDNFITQEHVILHELTHADIAGSQGHIDDIKVKLPSETNDVNIPRGITDESSTAYAWFAMSKYFRDAWVIHLNEPKGFINGSVTPLDSAHEQPNNGDWYAGDEFTDVEWTAE